MLQFHFFVEVDFKLILYMSDITGNCHLLLVSLSELLVVRVCFWDGDRTQSVCNYYASPPQCLAKDHIRAPGTSMTLRTMGTTTWMNTENGTTRYHLCRQSRTVTKVCFVYDLCRTLFSYLISLILAITSFMFPYKIVDNM